MRFLRADRGRVKNYRLTVLIVLLTVIPMMRAQQAPSEADSAEQLAIGLAPGDIVEAHFLDFPEASDMHLTVASDGTVFVPYAGRVKISGMMPEEAQAAIVAALKAKQVVAEPQVSVEVVSARNLVVTVLGAVTLPRPIPLYAPAPLSLVLSQVGPISTTASYHVLIAHRDGTAPEDVQLDRAMVNLSGLHVMVRPGDVVTVAQAGSFFALGEVNHPGIIPIIGTNNMTLLQALAVAGGPTSNATLSKARLLRLENGRRVEIEVDLAKLHDGKIADPMIHTDDILYVPRNYARVLVNSWLSQSLYALTVVNTVKTY